jgi:hypothetical protein
VSYQINVNNLSLAMGAWEKAREVHAHKFIEFVDSPRNIS